MQAVLSALTFSLPSNFWFLHPWPVFYLLQRRCPLPQFLAQLFQSHSPVLGRELFQLLQSFLKQRFCSLAVSLRMVVECRGYLRDALQKCLVRLRCLEPDGLPTLMRVEKLFRVELVHPLLELFPTFRAVFSLLQFAPSARLSA